MNVNDIAAKQESTLSHEDKLAYTSVFAAVAVAFNFFNFIFFSVPFFLILFFFPFLAMTRRQPLQASRTQFQVHRKSCLVAGSSCVPEHNYINMAGSR